MLLILLVPTMVVLLGCFDDGTGPDGGGPAQPMVETGPLVPDPDQGGGSGEGGSISTVAGDPTGDQQPGADSGSGANPGGASPETTRGQPPDVSVQPPDVSTQP